MNLPYDRLDRLTQHFSIATPAGQEESDFGFVAPRPSYADCQQALEAAPGLDSRLRQELIDVLNEVGLANIHKPSLAQAAVPHVLPAPCCGIAPAGLRCAFATSAHPSVEHRRVLLEQESVGSGFQCPMDGSDECLALSPTASDVDAALDLMPSPSPRPSSPELRFVATPLRSPTRQCEGERGPWNFIVEQPVVPVATGAPPGASGAALRSATHTFSAKMSLELDTPFTPQRPQRPSSYDGNGRFPVEDALATARARFKESVGAAARSGEFRASVLRELDAIRSSPIHCKDVVQTQEDPMLGAWDHLRD